MNRVVASICMAGVLGTAYYACPLGAQDEKGEVKEAAPKEATLKDAPGDARQLPTYREADPQSSNRPNQAKTVRPSFGRMLDDDGDHRQRPGVPGVPGLPHQFGARHHDRDVVFRRRIIMRQVQEEIAEPVPPEEQEEHKQFRGAIQQLKDAKDDANKKDEISKTIRELLNKQFERDLAHRESELAAVEERVKALRKQLEKRKSAKDDIITLRVKTIVNDVDGLGFPGEEGFRDDPTVRGLPDPAYIEHRTFDLDSPVGGQGPEATPRGNRPAAFPRPRTAPVR